MSTDFTSKNIEKLDCELCDFKCCKKGDYNRHVLTSKHKKLAKINNLSTHITQNTSYSSLLGAIPLQLLADYLSIEKGINPDKPKNLAKVVTVE